MDNDERMRSWCRMWNEAPELAHDLMTDDAVQWSGQGAGLDPVVGPEQQVRFLRAYRARHHPHFTPGLFVDGGDRFAYLWDLATPDGTIAAWSGAPSAASSSASSRK